MGIIEDWGLTIEDLNVILSERPSARGPLIGFVSEYKLQRGIFSDSRIHKLRRYDDHDRTRPADFSFEFQGEEITVEVKSLQTKSVRPDNGSGGYKGRCQVDASDRREVTLPDGSTLETTCLLPGKFDLLAINLFEFGHQWRFGFVRNRDLPRSRHRAYTDYQRENLLATSVPVTWPLTDPFVDSPFPLLEDIARERRRHRNR